MVTVVVAERSLKIHMSLVYKCCNSKRTNSELQCLKLKRCTGQAHIRALKLTD